MPNIIKKIELFKSIIIKMFNFKLVLSKIKQFFQTLLLKNKEYSFYNTSYKKCLRFNYSNIELDDKETLDIATVSFNNIEVIDYQIKFISKNIQDKYCYTVFDNSNDSKIANEIYALCKNNNIPYLKLPPNFYTGSLSHGSSLNWIYINYFKKRKANYFGLLDHDIFPVLPTKIINILEKQPVYGLFQDRKDLWYLWAGFCFFSSKEIGSPVNFKSGKTSNTYVDTGGMNWKTIYSKINKNSITFPKHTYEKIREGDVPQSDMVEYIDGWLHIFNASNWKSINNKDERDTLVKKILDNYLIK